MSEQNGTGIIYPTLELGGKTYTVKFTRGGLLYRLSKSGASFSDLISGSDKNFAACFDILYAALYGQYLGTVEDLVELAFAESKVEEVKTVVREAVKKAFPPTQTEAAGTVGQTAAPQVN